MRNSRCGMNSSLKGAFLSGLVYPGLGQIVQKHYFRGIALIGIVTVSLVATIISASRQAQEILRNIESSGGGYDVSTILHQAAISSGQTDRTMGISSLLIIGCWVAGIIDAYLSGKRIDSGNAAHNPYKASPRQGQK
jgi:hypothetical protein